MVDKRLRYQIVLGKFRVDRVTEHGSSLEFSIHLPNLGQLVCTGPRADVREGDLLTIYTEILSHAIPR